jgi:hypothetical protein
LLGQARPQATNRGNSIFLTESDKQIDLTQIKQYYVIQLHFCRLCKVERQQERWDTGRNQCYDRSTGTDTNELTNNKWVPMHKEKAKHSKNKEQWAGATFKKVE